MAEQSGAQFHHRINLDSGSPRQGGHADRAAGMLAGFAEQRLHQVRRAIGDFGLVGEIGRRVDEDVQLHDPLDAAEVAAQSRLDLRDQHQAAQFGGFLARHLVDAVAQPAGQVVAQAVSAAAAARPAMAGSPLFGSPLDSRFTFDTFVEGSSNRVSLAAAKTIAEAGSGAVRFNPLFVHATVGLGKTHLLQAIANAAVQNPRGLRVVYLTAEYFMWRFATAIRDNDALTLKDSLRNIDLLIIDDMQFLQGKMIQHEFCHLLNMLLDSAKQVVVAADRAPWELESLDPRVRSRLQGGVAIEVEAPDYEMRLEILKRRLDAARQDDPSLEIPAELLSHVARNVTASGRELEGAFNQLIFRRSFEPNLTVERVDELLAHLVGSGEPRRVRIEDIQRIVARHYNVSRQELVSNRRTRVIVKPRQIAMYLSKTLTPRSFPEIGRRFGGRDHTTVLHAVRKIEELISGDSKLSHEIELLKRLINE